jgi:hypothetical protein
MHSFVSFFKNAKNFMMIILCIFAKYRINIVYLAVTCYERNSTVILKFRIWPVVLHDMLLDSDIISTRSEDKTWFQMALRKTS